MNSIIKICKENNIKIIEDAAHALPTNYNGKLIGELDSEATVFSFYANKTMTTGEGGMIVTKNKDIYLSRTKLMRLHGIDRDSFNRFTSDSYKWYYDVVDAGFKYNLTDIAAAIGIVQLKKLFEMKEKRTAIAVKYCQEIHNDLIILPKLYPDGHSWHLYPIQVKDRSPKSREAFIDYLYENGISTSVHYTPLHRLTYWKENAIFNDADLINTNLYADSCVSLPIYDLLKDEEIDYIIKKINQFNL